MVERILGGRYVAGKLRHDPGEGVPRAVEVKTFNAHLSRVLLQVLDEAV